MLDIFPNTKQALRRCTQRRKCGRFRPFDRLHDYFFMRWYSLAYNDLLTPVTCFKSDTQEPYVVVRKSPDLPRFDERFVNYAYNKVQWIEHLRFPVIIAKTSVFFKTCGKISSSKNSLS